MKKISIVIPAYNEAQRIEKTLFEINNFLQKQVFEYEILVVNDGSKDQTALIIKKLESTIPHLRLIDNAENHGKGWVTKQGMLEAVGDVRLFMDADNSTKVDEILKFLPFFESGSDVVVGSRRIKGSVIAVKQGFLRNFLGGAFRFIVHTLVPVGVTDSQCGFKAFSAVAAQRVFHKQTIYRWAFDVELLAIARKEKLKIVEVPVTWMDDSESHVKLAGMINMLFEIFQIRLNLWSGKYNKQN